MTATTLAACSLAAWRLATVLTVDVLTLPLRAAARRRSARLGEFVRCTRCVSPWTALAVVTAAWAAGLVDGWRWWALGWWAAAGVSALVADATS